jgi:hypothetical protein
VNHDNITDITTYLRLCGAQIVGKQPLRRWKSFGVSSAELKIEFRNGLDLQSSLKAVNGHHTTESSAWPHDSH